MRKIRGEFTDDPLMQPTDFANDGRRLALDEIKTAMHATLDYPTLAEDLELVDGLVKHHSNAMNVLCQRYSSVLKAIIMKVLHDESEAEDVLQEVFLQVWDRAVSYSPEKGKLLSWLSTVARRRAIDRVRQTCAYRRATDRFEVVSRHPCKEISETHPVEHEAQKNDVRALIDRQLDLLPDQQREAICMAYLEGCSQREIASRTHTPLGTVKTRIELGLKKLSHAIGGAKDKII
jgi:RNA polymerase sigma-70 factor (ECF subfamily)